MTTMMMVVIQIAITPPRTPPMIGPMDWFRLGEVLGRIEVDVFLDKPVEGAVGSGDSGVFVPISMP
jgi:hypothetical protein